MAANAETMTSRERVLAALNHQQPDRVPIDLGGNQTGIHKFAYRSLIEHLRLNEEIEIMDAVQQLARPSEAVLERLRVDTRYIHAGAACFLATRVHYGTIRGICHQAVCLKVWRAYCQTESRPPPTGDFP